MGTLLAALLVSVVTTAPSHEAPAARPAPKLVITEIMYDPTSPESEDRQTEWVEICNAGEEPVNLQGFQLTSGTTADPHAARQKYTFRDVTVAPRAYLVVGIGAQAMYADYGLPPFGVYCDESRYAWFTNAGDSVAIRDADKKVIDEVIYSGDSPWPVTRGNGGSIQFICPNGADPQLANDEGKNWVASGASNSPEYPGHGRGTPGAASKAPAGKVAAGKSGASTRPAAYRKR